MSDNFIVITTREGARGIDFKGTSVSHVNICLSNLTSSLLMLALGRGSRDLEEHSTGTLITEKLLTKDKD
jgi:hypothetical protein